MREKITSLHLALLVLMLVNIQVSAQPRTTTVHSRISQITIKPIGAWVTRKCELELDSGETQIVLPGFDSWNESQVLAYLDNEQAKVNSYKLIPAVLESKEKGDTIRSLQDSLSQLRILKSINQKSRDILWDNRQIRVSDKSIYVDDLDEVQRFISKRTLALEKEAERLCVIEKRLELILDQFTLDQQQAIEKINRMKSLQLNISSNSKMRSQLTVTYFVEEAGWKPVYTLDYLKAEGAYILTSGAEIWQLTSSDWTGVEIRIEGLQKNHLGSSEYPSLSYKGSDNLNVKNDGKKQIIYHKKMRLQGTLEYVCHQHLGGELDIEMTINDLDGSSLQEGLAIIRCNGVVLGTSLISNELNEASMNVAINNATGIQVSKELIKEKSGKSFLSSKSKESYYYSLSITSTLPFSVSVKYIDDLGIERKPSSEIEYEGPKGISGNQEGLLSFSIELAAKTQLVVNYGYKADF